MRHPITSFTYYNGTPIPPGKIDNSFGDTDNDGIVELSYTIEMYVAAGDTVGQRTLSTIAANLNAFARDVPQGNATGLRFTVVPVPGGQQYVLASQHQIYLYRGGWVADYNHVLNWLSPMLMSTGTYFSWNLMNYTTLGEYVTEALAADARGDINSLLKFSNLANQFANDQVLYFYLFYPMTYFVRSSYLKGWYFNPTIATEYFTPMYYGMPWDLTGPTKWAPDGICDIRDLATVAKSFGSVTGDAGYDARADITSSSYLLSDGRVDIRDMELLAENYGKTHL